MQLCSHNRRNIQTHRLSKYLINTMIRGNLTKRIGQNISGREKRFCFARYFRLYSKNGQFFANLLDEEETIALISIIISVDRFIAITRPLSGLTFVTSSRPSIKLLFFDARIMNFPTTLGTLSSSFNTPLRDKKMFVVLFTYFLLESNLLLIVIYLDKNKLSEI